AGQDPQLADLPGDGGDLLGAILVGHPDQSQQALALDRADHLALDLDVDPIDSLQNGTHTPMVRTARRRRPAGSAPVRGARWNWCDAPGWGSRRRGPAAGRWGATASAAAGWARGSLSPTASAPAATSWRTSVRRSGPGAGTPRPSPIRPTARPHARSPRSRP